MKQAYIDYSMSVIVSRALPDVRDGFKPVHRRVLYGMNELGNTNDKPYKKSARIVGEVMGKYHPHGDSPIYMTLVRMAQDWSLRYPLVEPQGNFGSIDGDGPAAMRYTEARLQKIAEEMLKDIDKETVDFDPNFDETTKEPRVLPTRLPNLLVNGSQGIAVGMATNVAPHNLSEVCDAIVAMVDDPEITIEQLMHYVKAPDFPTGGFIYGYAGVKEAFETGRGRIVIRSKAEIENNEKTHDKIVITEIPYMVNRSELIKSIAALAIEKKVDGIANVNDESDRHGMRIVVDVKKDSNAAVLLNKLYKLTALQSSFSVNNIALVKGRPQLLNLKQILECFIEHRLDVIMRRARFDLRKAQERAELLEGCIRILDALDEAISIIRNSTTPEMARQRLMARFDLSDRQAQYIVDLRLRQLTGMEQGKLRAEYDELKKLIVDLEDILAREERRRQIIKDETMELKRKYGDERRTQIIYSDGEFNPEDFYSDDEMVITLSHLGYIKRTPLAEFKSQRRGGMGSRGSSSRDEDFIEYIYTASMHATILFFTQRGRCHWLKVYDIPEGNKYGKGRAIQNMLNIEPGDAINAFIRVKQLEDPDFNSTHNLVFCTKQGLIKKSCLSEYSRPRQKGINAITIREDDRVIEVHLTSGSDDILLASRCGKAIRFNETRIRTSGRIACGVTAMRFENPGDEIVGMITMPAESTDNVLVVSELGYGKRSRLDTYRITNRGGIGIRTINVTDKTGPLAAIKSVNDGNDLMIINESGVVIRLEVKNLKVVGRAAQGVRLINLGRKNDKIASVCVVPSAETTDDTTAEETQTDTDVTPAEE